MLKKTDHIKAYYGHRIDTEQQDFNIVGWESPEAQEARFEVLCRNIRMEGMRILDVGCGVGSLLGYMEAKGIHADYTGIDILPGMIEIARRRHPYGNRFLVGDIFSQKLFPEHSFDIIVSSGLFNLNMGNNHAFLRKAFTVLCGLALSTVALNLLHVKSQDKEDKYFYFHPEEVLKIIGQAAPRKPEVMIIEEYLPNDFTVICTNTGSPSA